MRRLPGALIRALLVALVIAAPSLLIPGASASAREVSAIIGLIAGAFVMFEYGAPNPGLVDFRFAPPYNRARFAVFSAALLLLTFYARALAGVDSFSPELARLALRLGALLDFPLSPVRLAVELLADPAAPRQAEALRGAAALGFVTGVIGAAFFGALLWIFPWPMERETFNLWFNMPTLETAYGRDLERRLLRLSVLVTLAGLAAPYLMLIVASKAGGLLDPAALREPLALVWAAALWGAAPPLTVLRGAIILKIALLVRRARE
ncbi:hypothetical protein SAMN05216200_103372 [Oceanicella actignis]|uniref:Uncharacterized protein n=1 Tax=Oceanicella actignis TaxID=1189325 RepID=A0A1M7SXI8_9RHOB|nr:hypothetical protein SAMN04488119_101370 [Oceanicella actignis]SHN63161.1 hypothetical protein SAMN05216200_103372 [Oceanicella actignis]